MRECINEISNTLSFIMKKYLKFYTKQWIIKANSSKYENKFNLESSFDLLVSKKLNLIVISKIKKITYPVLNIDESIKIPIIWRSEQIKANIRNNEL